jgi:adenylosuccinate lyase
MYFQFILFNTIIKSGHSWFFYQIQKNEGEKKMASTVIDSKVFRCLFSTEAMRRIFSDTNLVQKWLDTEAALAKAQAEVGMIPQEAAVEICAKAKADLLDLDEIGENYKSSITIVPLLKVFKKVLDNNAGEYVHWGATSQDIVDTGMILQIKEAHAEVDGKSSATASCGI